MMIASNCPPFDHLDPALDDSITEICELALVHCTSRIQRFPGRAHGKQGWKRKEHCGTLSDLYEEQAKAAKQAARACGSRVDSSDDEGGSDSDDDEIAGTDSGEEDNGGEESSYTEIGGFGGLDGWSILSDPAKTEEEWSVIKKKYPWNNRRLAHIWDPPFGWEISSFSLWEKGAPVFYYSTTKEKYPHKLPLETYGIDGHWVILEKK